MIDQREIGDADHGRYQNIENRLTHLDLLLNSVRRLATEERFGGPVCSAGALNAGEPIEEPQTDRASDVKNHFADLDFDFAVWSGCGCRCHRVSFSQGIRGKYVKLHQVLS
jgi:hypothetical protein